MLSVEFVVLVLPVLPVSSTVLVTGSPVVDVDAESEAEPSSDVAESVAELVGTGLVVELLASPDVPLALALALAVAPVSSPQAVVRRTRVRARGSRRIGACCHNRARRGARACSMPAMPLSPATLAAVMAGLPPGLRACTDLGPRFVAGLQLASAAWPAFVDDELPARIARRLTDECDLAALAWADLTLADACLRQLPGALAAFEASHGHELTAALAAANIDADARAEALQRLRLRLLVPEDGAPRLASYSGRGPLRTWLRVAALREALMLARASRRRAAHEVVDEDALLAAEAVAEDPELHLLQDRCRDALRTAFATAVAGLDSRARTLLRLALRDRLGVDQIGALYRVHRSTAARWLQAIREQLSATTRAELATTLALADAEVESLIRAIGSRLDLSLGSIAAPSPAT